MEDEVHCDPTKDKGEHPIPTIWRSTLEKIVVAFVQGDFTLSSGVPGVAAIPAEDAERIAANITDYGESLAALPAESWETSVAVWMGSFWETLIDLWTVQSGRSDLVLFVRVFEGPGGFRFEVDSLHVP
jgi:hypothetical protein